jgi:hypothetical protein
MVTEKMILPQDVELRTNEIIDAITETGFFDCPDIPKGYEDNARLHLYNSIGGKLLEQFLNGGEDVLLVSESEFEQILSYALIQTCLDSLLDEKLIDTIENEHGENVYWLTSDGKNRAKKLTKNC